MVSFPLARMQRRIGGMRGFHWPDFRGGIEGGCQWGLDGTPHLLAQAAWEKKGSLDAKGTCTSDKF